MRLLMVVLLCCVPLVCLAVPTGLNLMPTADVLSAIQTRVDYQSSGGGLLYVPSGETVVGVEGGAPLGLEAGVDRAGSLGAMYNAKWQVFGDGLVMPAIAVGVQGLNSKVRAQDYIVATKSLLPTSIISLSGLQVDARVSAGLLRQNDRTAVMYGASASLGALSIKADHVNGMAGRVRDGNAVSVGWTFAKCFTVAGTRYFYVTQPDVTTVSVNITFKP